jgi:hypothetical protein
MAVKMLGFTVYMVASGATACISFHPFFVAGTDTSWKLAVYTRLHHEFLKTVN